MKLIDFQSKLEIDNWVRINKPDNVESGDFYDIHNGLEGRIKNIIHYESEMDKVLIELGSHWHPTGLIRSGIDHSVSISNVEYIRD